MTLKYKSLHFTKIKAERVEINMYDTYNLQIIDAYNTLF